jgi:hypothetical protein
MSERSRGVFTVTEPDEAAAFARTLDAIDRAAFWRWWRDLDRKPAPTFFTTPHRRRPVGPSEGTE